MPQVAPTDAMGRPVGSSVANMARKGLLHPTAEVAVMALDVDSSCHRTRTCTPGSPLCPNPYGCIYPRSPYAPEQVDVELNGHPLGPLRGHSGGNGLPSLNTFEVPLEWLLLPVLEAYAWPQRQPNVGANTLTFRGSSRAWGVQVHCPPCARLPWTR